MKRASVPLSLTRPGRGRRLFRARRPRRVSPARRLLMGLLMILLGTGLLLALLRLPDQVDALLLLSSALSNLIAGLSRLGLGLAQLGGLLLAVLLALLALSLLVGGLVRLWRVLLAAPPAPRP